MPSDLETIARMTDTASSDRSTPTTARRLTLADAYRDAQAALAAALTRKDAEPWVTVEYTDAAKGEIRAVTKVSAPFGYDAKKLEDFALDVAAAASLAHESARLRKGPNADAA